MLTVARQKQLQQNKILWRNHAASICMLSKWFTTIFAWSDFKKNSCIRFPEFQHRDPGSGTFYASKKPCWMLVTWMAPLSHIFENCLRTKTANRQLCMYKEHSYCAVLVMHIAAAAPQHWHTSVVSRHIKARLSERTLRLSAVPLLDKPFTRTDFARRAFRCSVSAVWNSLPETIISVDSVFKSMLKTYFFSKAFD